MTDADAHKDGIGPCFCTFTDDMNDSWWEKWKYIVNVTKFGSNHSDFCPLSRLGTYPTTTTIALKVHAIVTAVTA